MQLSPSQTPTIMPSKGQNLHQMCQKRRICKSMQIDKRQLFAGINSLPTARKREEKSAEDDNFKLIAVSEAFEIKKI